jgi:hypothetical protein
VVDGAYQAVAGLFSRVVTDSHGTVHLERPLAPLIVVARTPDLTRARIVQVDMKATEAKIITKPTATATGRLVDAKEKPITRHEVRFGVRVAKGPHRNSPFYWHFGDTATTDATGQFRFPGLLVSQTYEVYGRDEARAYIHIAKVKVKPTDPGLLAVGDVVINLSHPELYVPPTPAERTYKAFAAQGEKTPREKLEYTLAEARREYTRPLLLFGNPKDPVCVELFRLLDEPSGGDGPKNEPPVKSPADLR